jgi:hypothetical protein
MLCYGAGNIANDVWFEQVVKRDWAHSQIPDVTTPKASVAWDVIILAAAAPWAITACVLAAPCSASAFMVASQRRPQVGCRACEARR